MLEQVEKPASVRRRDTAAADAPERRRARLLMAGGIAAFLAISVVVFAIEGIALSRDWLFGWLLLGLLALSLSDVKRWLHGVIFDWLPLMAVLLFYDLSRPVSEFLGSPIHVYPQIHADEALFGGTVPTVWLQHQLHNGPQVHWYDYAAWGVYMTHFFTTLVVAGLLWRFAYPRFRRFRTLVLGLATLGFATYVLFPAEPPWLASKWHHLAYSYGIIHDVFHDAGITSATALFENHSGFYNQFGAVPSLHAAYPLLIMLFFWSSSRWWVRLGWLTYTLAMAFVLVYTSEHYVVDILLGWIYAVATFAAVSLAGRWWEQRRSARAGPTQAATAEPAALR
ncbi:MAG: hypothetical protein QOD76_1638 [Solirubrobacteraceae bacterium]|nr:hypothetical protein [Solirubrobacteraceae bacterium]